MRLVAVRLYDTRADTQTAALSVGGAVRSARSVRFEHGTQQLAFATRTGCFVYDVRTYRKLFHLPYVFVRLCAIVSIAEHHVSVCLSFVA